MTATFFAIQTEFREWLEKHNKKEAELLVGFYKVNVMVGIGFGTLDI